VTRERHAEALRGEHCQAVTVDQMRVLDPGRATRRGRRRRPVRRAQRAAGPGAGGAALSRCSAVSLSAARRCAEGRAKAVANRPGSSRANSKYARADRAVGGGGPRRDRRTCAHATERRRRAAASSPMAARADCGQSSSGRRSACMWRWRHAPSAPPAEHDASGRRPASSSQRRPAPRGPRLAARAPGSGFFHPLIRRSSQRQLVDTVTNQLRDTVHQLWTPSTSGYREERGPP